MVDANTSLKNVLSSDVQVKGEIQFTGELHFDGKLEGVIRTEGNLLIGENAQVQGDAHVGNVAIRGKVTGNIVAAHKVDLRNKAEVQGDITAARLVMDESVTFCGKIDVNPTRSPASATPPRPVAQPAPAPRVEAVRAEPAVVAEPVRNGAGQHRVPAAAAR